MTSTFMRLCAAAVLAISASAVSAAGISDSFEDATLAPWYQDNVFSSGEDWNVTNADAYDGSYSATNTGNKRLRLDFGGIATGDITSISFAAYSVGSSAIRALSFIYDGTGEDQDSIFLTDQWAVYDVTAFLRANDTLVGFGIYGNSAGCPDCTRTYFDDFALVTTPSEVPVPAAGLLLVAGLGAFGAIRRRR